MPRNLIPSWVWTLLALCLGQTCSAEESPRWREAFRIDVPDVAVLRATLYGDGRRMLVTCDDKRARIVDSTSGKVLVTLGDGVNAHAWFIVPAQDGSLAHPMLWPAWGIEGCPDLDSAAQRLPLWSLADGELITELDLSPEYARGPIGLSADGQRLWIFTTTRETPSTAKSLQVFDVKSGRRLQRVAAEDGVLSPDGHRLLAWAGVLRGGRVVDVESGETLRRHGLAKSPGVEPACSRDGKRMAFVTRGNDAGEPVSQVQVYSGDETWPELVTSFSLTSSDLDLGSFSPQLDAILVRTRAGAFVLRRLEDGRPLWTHTPEPGAGARIHSNHPIPPMFSRSGDRAAVWWAEYLDSEREHRCHVTILDVATGQELQHLDAPREAPYLATYSAEAGVLVLRGDDGTCVVYHHE